MSLLSIIAALALPLLKLYEWWKGRTANSGEDNALKAKEEEVRVMEAPERSKSDIINELRKHEK